MTSTPPPPAIPSAVLEKPRVLRRKYTLLHPAMLAVLGSFFGPTPVLTLNLPESNP